jgi:hypothetical protein
MATVVDRMLHRPEMNSVMLPNLGYENLNNHRRCFVLDNMLRRPGMGSALVPKLGDGQNDQSRQASRLGHQTVEDEGYDSADPLLLKGSINHDTGNVIGQEPDEHPSAKGSALAEEDT